MTEKLDKKIKIVQNPVLTEIYLKNEPKIFKENKFELAEYSLIKGYTNSFILIFEYFYPEILILFEYGFQRDYTELVEYDKHARKHADYLKCMLPPEIRKKVYNAE